MNYLVILFNRMVFIKTVQYACCHQVSRPDYAYRARLWDVGLPGGPKGGAKALGPKS